MAFQQEPRSGSPLDPTPDLKRLTTNLKAFGVPFKINADNDAFIEVQLYLSRDQGKTWKFYARQTTDQEEFPFEADQDGEYWFALKTLNRDRQLLPSGDPSPQLKIVVDTDKPELDFRVQTDNAGRVLCRWLAKDKTLLPRSLKIYYQPVTSTGARKSWLSVPVQLNGTVRNQVYSDQIGFWPETDEVLVNVAVEIQDAAGNSTRLDRKVNLPATSWKRSQHSTARPRPITTQRPPYGAAPSSGTNQPDWAEPGWRAQPDAQVKSQVASQTDNPSKQITGTKPANVICENGICRIVGDGDGSFDGVGKRFTPNRDSQPSTNKTAGPTRSGLIRSAKTGQLPLAYVGSPEEYADPPVPPGYQPSPTQDQTAHTGNQAPGVVTWESEGQDWLPEQQSVSSTTRKIDPSILPLPSDQADSSPTTFVPSNPAETRFVGDQVISESTTRSPRNQYRGGKPTVGDLPAPELLPEQPIALPPLAKVPSTGLPGFLKQERGQLQRLPNDQPQSKRSSSFSNAGFQLAGKEAEHSASVVSSNGEKPLRETSAPVKMIRTMRFRLNYGIDAIDPSGVGRVVLWVTRDDGKTWNQWGNDPDNRSPFPVEVTEAGRYGFRIVIHSKDGLTGEGPASGDDADIWIHVDNQAPLTRIVSVPYGRGNEAGKLVINYSVADQFLTLRPITLSWSDQPEGPWNIIEAGVRNVGRYVWDVTREMPDKIYLRIEATDRAGNVGVHNLSRAIDISGLVPRGRIHGVTPVGE